VVDILWNRYKANDKEGKTVYLKIKFSNFTQITRAKTFQNVLTSKSKLLITLNKLLVDNYTTELPVRLIGASISGFTDALTEDKDKVDESESSQLKLL